MNVRASFLRTFFLNLIYTKKERKEARIGKKEEREKEKEEKKEIKTQPNKTPQDAKNKPSETPCKIFLPSTLNVFVG